MSGKTQSASAAHGQSESNAAAPSLDAQTVSAPLSLMVQFLQSVNDDEFERARILSQEILAHEPSNRMIQEYTRVLDARIALLDAEDGHAEEDESGLSEDEGDEDDDEDAKQEEDEQQDDGLAAPDGHGSLNRPDASLSPEEQ